MVLYTFKYLHQKQKSGIDAVSMTTNVPTPKNPEVEFFREMYQEWKDNLSESERKTYGNSVTGEEEMFCDFFQRRGTQILLSEFTEETRRFLNRVGYEAAKTTEGRPLIATLRGINRAIQDRDRAIQKERE